MGELVSTLIKLKDDLAILTPPELTGHKDMLKRDVSKAIGGAKMTWLDNKYVAVSEKEFQKIIWIRTHSYIVHPQFLLSISFSSLLCLCFPFFI